MNRILIVIFTFIFINTMGYSFANDKRLITTPNRSVQPAKQAQTWSDWLACRQAAMKGASLAIAQWQIEAAMKDVVINGVTAIGGSVMGPALQPSIEKTMAEAGVPAVVANGFASSVSNAWHKWALSLRVPGLNWYPAFACYAGAVAPPTPNVPMPIASLESNPEPLSASRLKESIRDALGTGARNPQALAAINEFADDLAARFTKYLTIVKVTNVIGTGSVPAFAPPFGPHCGPVVNGKGTMEAGGFVGTWPAN